MAKIEKSGIIKSLTDALRQMMTLRRKVVGLNRLKVSPGTSSFMRIAGGSRFDEPMESAALDPRRCFGVSLQICKLPYPCAPDFRAEVAQ
jgi:hypothetical protein